MAAGVAVSGLPQLAAATSAAKGVSKSQKASPQNAVWNHDQVALLIIDYQPEMFAAILREKDLTKDFRALRKKQPGCRCDATQRR
ncbi:hypothetical protein DB728_08535 [Rhizobium leguminosarum bv. viciae USDA 2370]|jgi:hypothetical protein|nr:hypothetical protein CHR56_26125 [Rhizobium leguminosarum bv. viciae]OOO46864.1 hypothetical protein BS629_19925 [Rhizobium leguminosarum bv. viciae USDA 2370]PUB65138.1 hypothetical protein DB728_08535 [Rhizobium leguminosarum bv. viciae USDA 2370]